MNSMSKVEKYIRKNYFKIVIGGDGGVGKTAFSKRLTGKLKEDEILEMTPGVDFHGLKIKNNIVNLQFWDLGGQDQFRYFQRDFFGGATIVILLFAVDSFKTFKSLDHWLSLLPEEICRTATYPSLWSSLEGRSFFALPFTLDLFEFKEELFLCNNSLFNQQLQEGV